MPGERVVIKFFAPVTGETVDDLLGTIDDRLRQGAEEFAILMSTPGGNVHFGLSAYNYLKGIPARITMHNFGSVDSIGLVLFCSGDARYCVPQASFLVHGVTCNFLNESLDEKDLEERLKSVRVDSENIARVIAANSNLEVEEVTRAMFERTTLNPEQALEWGIVHEIRSELFEQGEEVVSVQLRPDRGPREEDRC